MRPWNKERERARTMQQVQADKKTRGVPFSPIQGGQNVSQSEALFLLAPPAVDPPLGGETHRTDVEIPPRERTADWSWRSLGSASSSSLLSEQEPSPLLKGTKKHITRYRERDLCAKRDRSEGKNEMYSSPSLESDTAPKRGPPESAKGACYCLLSF